MVRNGRALVAWASTTVLVGALAGCGDVGGGTIGGDGGEENVLRIGFVSTETGSSAPFGEANAYVIEAMEEWFADNPVTVDGSEHAVEIIVKDSQSSSARAGGAGLRVLHDDLDGVLAPVDGDRVVREPLLHRLDHVGVGLAERCGRARLGRDEADP
jgi:branched-chain amino acid transport system substrate-binding protein